MNENIFIETLKGVEKDIIKNSYYVIYYFKSKGKTITNLKLQKLMYFMEAIYMAVVNEDSFFNQDFVAWEFGPVCKELYEKYSNFESFEIELTNEQEDFAKKIPAVNKTLIEILFSLFGDWSTYALVDFSHSDGSPWCNVYNGENSDNVVLKVETKEWFKEKVGLNESK